jgi:hypothetical protein
MDTNSVYLALHSAELASENLDDLAAYSREMRKLITRLC